MDPGCCCPNLLFTTFDTLQKPTSSQQFALEFVSHYETASQRKLDRYEDIFAAIEQCLTVAEKNARSTEHELDKLHEISFLVIKHPCLKFSPSNVKLSIVTTASLIQKKWTEVIIQTIRLNLDKLRQAPPHELGELLQRVNEMESNDLSTAFLIEQIGSWKKYEILFFIQKALNSRHQLRYDPNMKVKIISLYFRDHLLPTLSPCEQEAILTIFSGLDYVKDGIMRTCLGLPEM